MSFLSEYLGEIILLGGVAVLRLFGRNESAEALLKKRRKKCKKLRKKVLKESEKLQDDFTVLKELEAQDDKSA